MSYVEGCKGDRLCDATDKIRSRRMTESELRYGDVSAKPAGGCGRCMAPSLVAGRSAKVQRQEFSALVEVRQVGSLTITTALSNELAAVVESGCLQRRR